MRHAEPKKKKKKKPLTISSQALEKAQAPGKNFWEDYYAQDKFFFGKNASGETPALALPPVERVLVVYGVNVQTELSYFFKLNNENPALVQSELDNGVDSYSKKESKELNPQGLVIRDGIMYETKTTMQPAFGKRAISGDGSIRTPRWRILGSSESAQMLYEILERLLLS